MTVLITLGIYVTIGVVVGLVAAYKTALEARLAGKEPDWSENGPDAVGIGIVWPVVALVFAGWWVFTRIARAVDAAATAEAAERRVEEERHSDG